MNRAEDPRAGGITRRALFALVGAGLLLAGCGRKGDLKPPEGEEDRFQRSYPPPPGG